MDNIKLNIVICGLDFISVEKTDEINIKVEIPEEEQVCPVCDSHEYRKYGHARERRFKDVPINNLPTYVSVIKRNHKCLKCETIFCDEHNFFYNKNMTSRLRTKICEMIALGKSNLSIAKTLFIDEKTVRRIKHGLKE